MRKTSIKRGKGFIATKVGWNPIGRTYYAKVGKEASRVAKQPKKPHHRTERQKLDDEVWDLCRKIIFQKYRNSDGTWTCYTSGKRIKKAGINLQCGHGKPKGALPLLYKYDLRNLRPQSFNANMHYGGESDIFIAKLEQEPLGLEFLEEACEKTDGIWKIKHIEPMGGKDAILYLRFLKEYYKTLITTL